MAEGDIKWKGVEVLDVSGLTLKVGTFTGTDGVPTPFTPDLVNRIYDKIDKPVPFYFTHGLGGDDKVKIGYAHKFGIDPNTNELHYKSFVFEDGVKEQIVQNGYTSTSAEVDYTNDENGTPIDGTLTGIALVQNPAVPGTGIKVSAVAFAKKPKGEPMVEGTTSIKAFSSTRIGVERLLLEKGFSAGEVTTLFEMLGEINKGDNTKHLEAYNEEKKTFESQISALTKELEAEKKKNTEFEMQLGNIYKSQLAGAINEVKALGFSDPDKMVEGLPIQQQIITLSKIKENFATQKGLSTPPGIASPGASSPSVAFQEVIAEMGLGAELARLKPKVT